MSGKKLKLQVKKSSKDKEVMLLFVRVHGIEFNELLNAVNVFRVPISAHGHGNALRVFVIFFHTESVYKKLVSNQILIRREAWKHNSNKIVSL